MSNTKSYIEELKNDPKFQLFVEESFTGNLDGGAGQPQTPFAFASSEDERDYKQSKVADQTGYPHKVDTSKKKNTIYSEIMNQLSTDNLHEASYKDYKAEFKGSGKNPKHHINDSIAKINRSLREIEQAMNHINKLKMETNTTNTQYLKPTFSKLLKISERLNRIQLKMKDIGS